jgi:hypothetical protein
MTEVSTCCGERPKTELSGGLMGIRCEQCGRSASAQLVLPPNCKTFRMIQRQINKQAAPLVREWNAAEVAA